MVAPGFCASRNAVSIVAPGVRPAALVLGLSGTVVIVPGPAPAPPVALHATPVPHWACVRFMLVQPTVSKPTVATLLRVAVTPASTPNLSHVLLKRSAPRAP